MTTLGFTGTRNIAGNEDKLRDYLESAEMKLFLREFDCFVTGGCRGWDAFVGRKLALDYPSATHVVIVPANRSQVDPWWEKFDIDYVLVVYMKDGTDYRDRNTEIVRRSSQVFYCADYPEKHGKSKRSGTWMTKRIAEDHDVPVSGIVLNQEEAQSV